MTESHCDCPGAPPWPQLIRLHAGGPNRYHLYPRGRRTSHDIPRGGAIIQHPRHDRPHRLSPKPITGAYKLPLVSAELATQAPRQRHRATTETAPTPPRIPQHPPQSRTRDHPTYRTFHDPALTHPAGAIFLTPPRAARAAPHGAPAIPPPPCLYFRRHSSASSTHPKNNTTP